MPTPTPGPPLFLDGHGDSVATCTLDWGKKVFALTHAGDGNFIVVISDSQGSEELLVNEVGPYSGSILVQVGGTNPELAPGPCAMEIQAGGSWQIEISGLGDLAMTPVPTPTPLPPEEGPPSAQLRLFGPLSGGLLHDPTDRAPAVALGPGIHDYMMVNATFRTPDPNRSGEWEHGFILLEPGADSWDWEAYHRVSIRSDGTWRHGRALESDQVPIYLATGESLHIEDNNNIVRLVITWNEGWLYINSEFQAKLKLDAVDFRQVLLFADLEQPNSETPYKNFSLWTLVPDKRYPGAGTWQP